MNDIYNHIDTSWTLFIFSLFIAYCILIVFSLGLFRYLTTDRVKKMKEICKEIVGFLKRNSI